MCCHVYSQKFVGLGGPCWMGLGGPLLGGRVPPWTGLGGSLLDWRNECCSEVQCPAVSQLTLLRAAFFLFSGYFWFCKRVTGSTVPAKAYHIKVESNADIFNKNRN